MLVLWGPPPPERLPIENSAKAIRKFVSSLSPDAIAQVVIGSTGGLERPIIKALTEASIPVALINPSRVRHFAKASGLYAKTDELDARILAAYGKSIKLRSYTAPSEEKLNSQISALAVDNCLRWLLLRKNVISRCRVCKMRFPSIWLG